MEFVKQSKRVTLAHDVLVFAVIWLVFSAFAAERLIELDAGFYAVAARLVSEGKLLYVDFFYPQMTLLPYILAVPVVLFGSSWEVMRIFAATTGALTGLVLFRYIRTRFSPWLGWLGVALFVTGGLSLPWFTTTKSYPSAALFSLLAFGAAFPARPHRDRAGELRAVVICAITLALAYQTRLYLAVLILPLLYGLWINCPSLTRRQKIVWFLVPFALASLPTFIYLTIDAGAFWFNNVSYHNLRSSYELSRSIAAKTGLVKSLIGLQASPELPGSGWQLMALGVIVWTFISITRRTLSPSVLVIAMLGVTSLVPTPSYMQYFCLLTPFVIIACTELIDASLRSQAQWRRILAVAFGVVLLVSHFSQFPSEWERYTRTGIGLPGMDGPESAVSWSRTTIEAVSRLVNQNTLPGEFVLAGWSGYLFATHATPYPGTENRFGLKTADRLSPDRQRRFKLVTRATLRQRIARRAVRVVIENAPRAKPDAPGWLSEVGYELKGRIGRTGVYVLKAERPLAPATAEVESN